MPQENLPRIVQERQDCLSTVVGVHELPPTNSSLHHGPHCIMVWRACTSTKSPSNCGSKPFPSKDHAVPSLQCFDNPLCNDRVSFVCNGPGTLVLTAFRNPIPPILRSKLEESLDNPHNPVLWAESSVTSTRRQFCSQNLELKGFAPRELHVPAKSAPNVWARMKSSCPNKVPGTVTCCGRFRDRHHQHRSP